MDYTALWIFAALALGVGLIVNQRSAEEAFIWVWLAMLAAWTGRVIKDLGRKVKDLEDKLSSR